MCSSQGYVRSSQGYVRSSHGYVLKGMCVVLKDRCVVLKSTGMYRFFILYNRYFAKPTPAGSTVKFSLSRQPSCPTEPSSSEKPSALQMLDCSLPCTSSQSTTDQADDSLDQHFNEEEEEEESMCSVPESPTDPHRGASVTSAQSLPDLSSRTCPPTSSGFPAKKRLSFVLREACQKSHDFTKRPKVIGGLLDDTMTDPSNNEQNAMTEPSDSDQMERTVPGEGGSTYQGDTQSSGSSIPCGPLVNAHPMHEVTGDTLCDMAETCTPSPLSPVAGTPEHFEMCDGVDSRDAELSGDPLGCSKGSKHFVQSADMITAFEHTGVATTVCCPPPPGGLEHLVDLTNENTARLIEDKVVVGCLAMSEVLMALITRSIK